jgi:two-component system response regulator YesN
MYNVLIVDDEPRICTGLKVFIAWEEIGFRVVDTAQDGEEALEKLSKARYNLVITDIRMPAVDGLELIKTMHTQNPSVKVLIISGYNNFEYAREAIEFGVRGYLLKPLNREDLLQNVLKVKAELDREFGNLLKSREKNNIGRERVLFDLANGNLSEKDILLKSQEYSVNLNTNRFSVALLEIDGFSHLFETDLEGANLTKFSVRNIAEEIILENKLGYLYEDLNGTLGILLCTDNSELSEELVSDCLHSICSNINKYLNITINIGFGDFTDKLSEVKISRKQARIALERRIMLGKETVIPYSKVIMYKTGILDLEWSNETLLASIEIADKPAVENEVERVINEISMKCFPKEIIYGIVYNIILGICAVVKGYNGDATELLNLNDINIIKDEFTNMTKLKQWLLSICIKTCDYNMELQERKSSSIFSQIRKYIDENYNEDLSLKSLADVFYMNPAYMGRLFKNNMGENFNDYLNKVRIAEVKKRFFQKDSKIYDIIASVGYSNHEHFYRQFKRYEGRSFAEFKEHMNKQK